MFELADTVEQVKDSVRKYQVAITAMIGRPSRVRAWYYIPSLAMVAPAEFAGYKDIKLDYFSRSAVNPQAAESHLEEKGWFRKLQESDPDHARARSLTESISKLQIFDSSIRFYVLRDEFDKGSGS